MEICSLLEGYNYNQLCEIFDIIKLMKNKSKPKKKVGRPNNIFDIDSNTIYPVDEFNKINKIKKVKKEDKRSKYNYILYKENVILKEFNMAVDCMHFILDEYNIKFNYEDIYSMCRSFSIKNETIVKRNLLKYKNFRIEKKFKEI